MVTPLEQGFQVIRSGGLKEFPTLAWEEFHHVVLGVHPLHPHNLLLQVVSD